MTTPQWRQATITFGNPDTAVQIAMDHLAPILTEAETRGLITCWFYVRKGDWRLRYLPTADTPTDSPTKRHMTTRLDQLVHDDVLHRAVAGIYEPEVHAFGGPQAMDTAHQLWHHDSRHLLTRSAATATRDREVSIMLCATMMRAAGLDWYEQGDVWACVADHRDPPALALAESLQQPTHRLLTVDPADLTRKDAPLAGCHEQFDAYTHAGQALRELNQRGRLHRGLRATLAHHVIFAWNRRSIPGAYQAALATAAKTVVFGPDPTACPSTPRGDS
ncbi:thiopeptide-type bacteriocin biosynthesis protein [Nocardioides sp. NBC_00368]|uniref:thiopeptide-type bacteriocin biosynthesis protein n=1 Tax=unclassified Nocardioides TaxID=2615069 RepID=UPI00199CF2D9|nr:MULTISPECIES: thiopeptide-type bacteriocin biosynthesis protein [unclassified Nocardioides]MBC7277092.1 methyltransferase [Nocardioides sp.]